MSNTLTMVRLLAVPLENDYKHSFYFDNVESQTNYFLSKAQATQNECTYQRKDKIIRFDACIDDIITCNYVMYKNSAHSNKWYYAFITKMEYKNDAMTEIYIETDVVQTWLFDYRLKTSFIEREHVDYDEIGFHTVPEKLETGEYVCNNKNSCYQLNPKIYVVGSTVDLSGADEEGAEGLTFPNVSGKAYGKIYSGVRYFGYTNSEDLNNVLKNVADKGKSDCITSIFIAPVSMLQTSGNSINGVSDGETWGTMTDGDKTIQTKNFKPQNLNGYTPRNNKLFTFPYCYMLMSNNAGGCAVYHYEKFSTDTCEFKIYGALTPSFSGRLVPQNYNGVIENNEEGLTMCKLPICNWATDVYTNWLTQNAINIGISAVSSVGTVVAGGALLATGGGAFAGAGMIASGLTSIASTVGEVYQHSLQPPQAEGNLNSGDATYSMGEATFTAYQMSVKKEFAEIIDNYFTMFGYKVNRVGVPLKNHRSRFWHVKTIDVNIDGNLPQEDLQKIKQCYNAGITFWKDHAGIQNYSADNAIV